MCAPSLTEFGATESGRIARNGRPPPGRHRRRRAVRLLHRRAHHRARGAGSAERARAAILRRGHARIGAAPRRRPRRHARCQCRRRQQPSRDRGGRAQLRGSSVHGRSRGPRSPWSATKAASLRAPPFVLADADGLTHVARTTLPSSQPGIPSTTTAGPRGRSSRTRSREISSRRAPITGPTSSTSRASSAISTMSTPITSAPRASQFSEPNNTRARSSTRSSVNWIWEDGVGSTAHCSRCCRSTAQRMPESAWSTATRLAYPFARVGEGANKPIRGIVTFERSCIRSRTAAFARR